MKLSSSILFTALYASQYANIDAFSVQSSPTGSLASSYAATKNTALHATIEKTRLTPPSEIPDDDVAGMFEEFVVKTYG